MTAEYGQHLYSEDNPGPRTNADRRAAGQERVAVWMSRFEIRMLDELRFELNATSRPNAVRQIVRAAHAAICKSP